jgi:hypothetical protein
LFETENGSMRSPKLLLLNMFFLVSKLSAAPLQLDEKSLYEHFNESAPMNSYSEVDALGSELSSSIKKDLVTPSLYSEGGYMESKEKQLSSFIPVTSPSKSLEIGMRQKTLYGMGYSLAGYTEQYTNNFLRRASTSGIKAALNVDLYRDFLGSSTRNDLRGLEEEAKWKRLQADSNKKGLFHEIRKLYYSLLANSESQSLVSDLIATSEKQVRSSQDRLNNRAADVGEVAKYRSQLAARKAQSIGLMHKQELLLRSLKEMLPSLKDKELSLKKFDEKSTSTSVLACTQKVFTFKTAPFEFTSYDEMATLVSSAGEYKEKSARSLSGIDLKLMSEYKTSGKALGYSESFDDFQDDKKSSYQVGFMIDIPLDFDQKKSADLKSLIEKKYKEAKSSETLSKVVSLHEQTLKSIAYLNEVIKEQANNTKYLNESLNETQRKFRQARVGVEQLVYEQDLYQQSKLMEIDTKLMMVHTLLDYLSVYDQFPCEFNKI